MSLPNLAVNESEIFKIDLNAPGAYYRVPLQLRSRASLASIDPCIRGIVGIDYRVKGDNGSGENCPGHWLELCSDSDTALFRVRKVVGIPFPTFALSVRLDDRPLSGVCRFAPHWISMWRSFWYTDKSSLCLGFSHEGSWFTKHVWFWCCFNRFSIVWHRWQLSYQGDRTFREHLNYACRKRSSCSTRAVSSDGKYKRKHSPGKRMCLHIISDLSDSSILQLLQLSRPVGPRHQHSSTLQPVSTMEIIQEYWGKD